MIAPEASARSTSDSLMPPMPVEMMLTLTSADGILPSASVIASAEPCTSDFTIRFSSFSLPPAPILAKTCSMRIAWAWASLVSRRRAKRTSASSRALRSSDTTMTSSPASGTPDRPSTSTGIDGPADFTGWRASLNIARTRPKYGPVSSMSPCLSVPELISTVATGPRPFSRLDSTIEPRAGASIAALSSSTSACTSTASSSLSTPSPVWAETPTNCVSPPQSSGMTSSFDMPVLTLSMSDCGLSIFVTATTIGTLAALACLMASRVCGMTPSSPATTRMTMSVIFAPRARMRVKAAWPGVSRNVMVPFSVFTLYAPMCWVMPPASPAATRVLRM